MPRRFIFLSLLASYTIFGVSAQTSEAENAARARWEREWNAIQVNASFVPSKLTRELVRTEIGEREGETAEARADRAFTAALDIERALRLGYTYQETRARLRQSLRLESSVGTEKGKRMTAKLAKVERKNSVGGTGTGRAAKIGAGKDSGKGKNGR